MQLTKDEIRLTVLDILWESEYYNGVNKSNRHELNPSIGLAYEKQAERIAETVLKMIHTLLEDDFVAEQEAA